MRQAKKEGGENSMSALTEKLKAKKQALNDSAFWHPEEGDTLEGEVVKRGTTITREGEAEFAEIATEDGKIVTIFLNSVLLKEFEKEKIEEGDTIAIEYLGKVKSRKSQREYKNFIAVKDDSGQSQAA